MSDVQQLILGAGAVTVICFIAVYGIYSDADTVKKKNNKTYYLQNLSWYAGLLAASFLFAPYSPPFFIGISILLYPIIILATDIYARERGFEAERKYMANWFKTEIEPQLDPTKSGKELDAKIEELLKKEYR